MYFSTCDRQKKIILHDVNSFAIRNVWFNSVPFVSLFLVLTNSLYIIVSMWDDDKHVLRNCYCSKLMLIRFLEVRKKQSYNEVIHIICVFRIFMLLNFKFNSLNRYYLPSRQRCFAAELSFPHHALYFDLWHNKYN